MTERGTLHLEESAEKVELDFTFDVSLRNFEIKPPRVYGIVSVGDKVAVKVRLALKKSSPELQILPAHRAEPHAAAMHETPR